MIARPSCGAVPPATAILIMIEARKVGVVLELQTSPLTSFVLSHDSGQVHEVALRTLKV